MRDEILCKYTSSYIKRKLHWRIATICSTKQDSIAVVNYMKEKEGNWRDKKPQVSHDIDDIDVVSLGILQKAVLQEERFVESVD